MFYKINFEEGFFGDLGGDLAIAKQLHKTAVANLNGQISGAVTADQIFNNLLEANKLFLAAVQETQLPQLLWNPKARGYIKTRDPINQAATIGLIDGVIEEVSGLALLLSLTVDYFTDPETKAEIDQNLSDFEFKEVLADFVEQRKQKYRQGSEEEIAHHSGKDLVGVASLLTGVGAVLKVAKKGVTFTKDLTTAVKRWAKRWDGLPPLSKALKDFFDALGKSEVLARSKTVIPYQKAKSQLPSHYRMPYRRNFPIEDIVLDTDTYFVRVFPDGGNSVKEWLMSIEDFKALRNNPHKIKDVMALPVPPNNFALVKVPAGELIRKSKAAQVKDWGKGGGVQYEVLDWERLDTDVKESWYKEVGQIK